MDVHLMRYVGCSDNHVCTLRDSHGCTLRVLQGMLQGMCG